MFRDLKNGLKALKNKKTPLVIILFLVVFLISNFLSNILMEDLVLGISLKEYPSFLINYYGFDLIWFLLLFFFVFFISNYVIFLVSHIVNNSKKRITEEIPNCFRFTILISLIYFILFSIYYFSFLYLGVFSIIIVLIVGIVSLVISIYTMFGLMFLAVSKNIKESLRNAWFLLKKKFWSFIFLIIVVAIINFILSASFLSLLDKHPDMIFLTVIFYVLTILFSIYSLGVFSSFIKKR